MIAPYYSDELVTLYHGDCRDVLPQVEAIDSLITDPPYGMDVAYGRTALGTRRIVGDEDGEAYEWLLANVPAHMNDEAWGVVFCDFSSVGAVQQRAITAGFGVKTVIVWDKQMPSLGMGIRNQHELAVLLRRGMPSEKYTGGNVWRFTREHGRPDHPHMKPQAIMLRLVDYYSPPDGVVLDPFCGSGSTLVAAKALGRRAVGIEIDEAYCEIAAKRFAQEALDFGEASA